MYSRQVLEQARALRARGLSISEVSRQLGVSRASVRTWCLSAPSASQRRDECPLCTDAVLDASAYASLLGFYLGDGTLSEAARYYSLRISCDADYPEIIADVSSSIRLVRPRATVFRVRAPGVIVVQANWRHWPCLFPQHGPGRKHERPIVLAPWQRRIVDEHPAPLLRGLFHSDGSRLCNNVTRRGTSGTTTYRYPRWQFSNRSDDIHRICQDALDLVGVPWRRSSAVHTSVSTRAGVAALDTLIGPKR